MTTNTETPEFQAEYRRARREVRKLVEQGYAEHGQRSTRYRVAVAHLAALEDQLSEASGGLW